MGTTSWRMSSTNTCTFGMRKPPAVIDKSLNY
jgi:hypothetical protein